MTEPIAPGAGLNLQRIKPRVLRQEVLTALRTAILANEISAGSRLLEADVAEQMGVSRAPVREAIRHLEQEGLVEIFPHRGAVVVGLPETEIDAIYELRAVIEGRATAASVGVVGDAELVRHIWSSLDGLVRVRSYQALDRPGATARYFLSNAASSHAIIVDAIRAGDPEAAAVIARQHVLEVPTMLAGLGRPERASRGKSSTRAGAPG